MTELVYFNDSKVELQKEMRKHDALLEQIAEAGLKEWEDQLAMTAAYCGVMLDGFYTQDQLFKLEDILFFKLRAKRSIIIC